MCGENASNNTTLAPPGGRKGRATPPPSMVPSPSSGGRLFIAPAAQRRCIGGLVGAYVIRIKFSATLSYPNSKPTNRKKKHLFEIRKKSKI